MAATPEAMCLERLGVEVQEDALEDANGALAKLKARKIRGAQVVRGELKRYGTCQALFGSAWHVIYDTSINPFSIA